MSYVRTLALPFLLPVALVMVAAGPLRAEEEPRVWTNAKGKTVSGVLQEKGDGWAKILIKGTVHKLALESLSKDDQDYIKNAKLDEAPMPAKPDEPMPDDPKPDDAKPDDAKPDDEKPDDEKPDEKPKTTAESTGGVVALKVSEVDPEEDATVDTNFSASRLKFEVKGVGEDGVHCILVWVANFKGGGGTAVHSTAENYFPKDGEYFMQEIFSNNSQSGASYKGYAVRLLSPKYEKVAEMASESKYGKYLDEQQRRMFPGSLPDAK